MYIYDDIIMEIIKWLPDENIIIMTEVSKQFYYLIFHLRDQIKKRNPNAFLGTVNFQNHYPNGIYCTYEILKYYDALDNPSRQLQELIMASRNIDLSFIQNNQTDVICMAAIKENPGYLQYVKNQYEHLCLTAVMLNGYALRYVKNKTFEICLAAVTNEGYALQFIDDVLDIFSLEQLHEICMAGIRQNGYAIQFVREPNLKMCLEAIKENDGAIDYIKYPFYDICCSKINKK